MSRLQLGIVGLGKIARHQHIPACTTGDDVRVWHPGQRWIWQPGGLGVFDPGINALSILTHLIPGVYRLSAADLSYPANCHTPIAAQLAMVGPGGVPTSMTLDFLHEGAACWDIVVETDCGKLVLSEGGNQASVDGRRLPVTSASSEYSRLYTHFARLVRERRLDVDMAPLQVVADAFLTGRRIVVGEFVG